ncbi:hypothetical protein C8J56DRAFT_1164684 [Mycena floridula]|nr:hypothetical protein C8J56DRAFT_1164684 [Mycena floridula]
MPSVTRRLTRIQKCILNVFPNEITTEIISFCDTSSRASLCRVSKLFKQLAHRRLYELVELDNNRSPNVNKIARFSASLDANPEYATWVQDLSLAESAVYQYYGITDFIDTILRKTAELRRLSLSTTQSLDFVQLSFPKLHSFRVRQSSANATSLTLFLNRHPTLMQVSLSAFTGAFTAPVDLPNLVKYEGRESTFLDVLQNVETLRFVKLKIWNPEELEVLARFSTCQHVCLEAFIRLPGLRVVLQRLKHHLPRLASLFLVLFLQADLSLKAVIIEELAGFGHLESFGIRLYSHGSLEYRRSTMDSCLKSCPTLREFLWLHRFQLRIHLQSHQWHFSTNAREVSAGRFFILMKQAQPILMNFDALGHNIALSRYQTLLLPSPFAVSLRSETKMENQCLITSLFLSFSVRRLMVPVAG